MTDQELVQAMETWEESEMEATLKQLRLQLLVN